MGFRSVVARDFSKLERVDDDVTYGSKLSTAFVSKYIQATGRWSRPIPVSETEGVTHNELAVAVDKDGNVAASWVEAPLDVHSGNAGDGGTKVAFLPSASDRFMSLGLLFPEKPLFLRPELVFDEHRDLTAFWKYGRVVMARTWFSVSGEWDSEVATLIEAPKDLQSYGGEVAADAPMAVGQQLKVVGHVLEGKAWATPKGPASVWRTEAYVTGASGASSMEDLLPHKLELWEWHAL